MGFMVLVNERSKHLPFIQTDDDDYENSDFLEAQQECGDGETQKDSDPWCVDVDLEKDDVKNRSRVTLLFMMSYRCWVTETVVDLRDVKEIMNYSPIHVFCLQKNQIMWMRWEKAPDEEWQKTPEKWRKDDANSPARTESTNCYVWCDYVNSCVNKSSWTQIVFCL